MSLEHRYIHPLQSFRIWHQYPLPHANQPYLITSGAFRHGGGPHGEEGAFDFADGVVGRAVEEDLDAVAVGEYEFECDFVGVVDERWVR